MSSEIRQMWERYIFENKLDSSKMDKMIIDSWKLSKKFKVNPNEGIGNKILTTSDFQKRLKENETLISLAKRSLDRFGMLFKNMDFILVLTDADGYILWQAGPESLQGIAREMGFLQGSQWTESVVGTNAIGIALRTKEANIIHGYEHFAKASQQWSCVSSPILGENSQVKGVVDLSMPSHYPKKIDFLVRVQLIADYISEALQKKAYEDQKYMLQFYSTKKQVGILCDSSMTILHISPDLIENPENMIGKKLTHLPKSKWLLEKQEPIWREKECIGYFVSVLKNETKNKTFQFPYIVGRSQTYNELLEEVKIVAPTSAPIHLFGETGTGKEVLAKTIHMNSPFSNGRLVCVNCGALPENLMESELFGYEKGAFTGAHANGYQGKIEQAHNGTLFLDEIEDMPASMQSDLLRVLQEKKITRIGGSKEIPLHFRLITASNQNLKKLVMEGQFREDLFYRIYVCPLHIPPLRERKEDICEFIKAFEESNSWFPHWENTLIEVAEQNQWNGNIRELNNFLERCYVYYRERIPSKEQLVELIHKGGLNTQAEKEGDTANFKDQIEKEQIKNALLQHNGNIPLTAEQLSMSKSTLYRKMKKYHLN
ncbi:sigma-54-dependent Fis family transcriptional regulator [Metabacillus litoralis]|uniref:sigma-54-dependent Fis family transcriptional regulator n=1 Tax=Metabacillus TaxID=2675233 RepID=UPI001B9DD23C|nr:sigma-54-dependent Fis family transcriptional regulator [Metabacillus litoralis]UHA58899.1 sigma-54-dependent Fis family transcriptional regulator [Metabacillus litoralis]